MCTALRAPSLPSDPRLAASFRTVSPTSTLMCGRARCTLNPHQIARGCGLHSGNGFVAIEQMDRFRASYNIAPGSYMPVVVPRGPNDAMKTVHYMKWGLVPRFTKKTEKPDHFRMFNARSESVQEKVSFRRLVPKNRCIVPAEGFYEWKKDGSKKQPYYIHFKDLRPLFFAALYDYWENSDGEILYTFTILTTCSSARLQRLHDRMPVILGNKDSISQWLDDSRSNFESVLVPYECPDLVWYAVTPAMGKTSFDGPECITEIQLKPIEKNPISKFCSMKNQNEIKLGPKIQDSNEAPAAGLSKNLTGETCTEDIDICKSSLLHVDAKKEENIDVYKTSLLQVDSKKEENIDVYKTSLLQVDAKKEEDIDVYKTSLLQVDAKKEENIFETIKGEFCGYKDKERQKNLKDSKVSKEADFSEPKEALCDREEKECMIKSMANESMKEVKEPSSDEAKECLNVQSDGKIKEGGKRRFKKIATASQPKITTEPLKSSSKKKNRSLKTASDRQPSLLYFFEKI